MDADSTYDLQKIDCNCNNCVFMYRDKETWQYWHNKKRNNAEIEFNMAKAKAISETLLIEDESNRNGMLRIADKMKFQFDKTGLISYGKCSRFGKSVSFISDICQLETQNCFVHRKEFK